MTVEKDTKGALLLIAIVVYAVTLGLWLESRTPAADPCAAVHSGR